MTKSRNPGELAELALSYLPDVCAYVRRLSRGSPDCDDLVQDVFERALASLCDLEEPASVRPWLLRIARNRVIDWQRARSARPELRLLEPGDSPGPEPSVSPDRVERADAAALESALATLSPELRDAVLLSDVWGCAYAEIAEVLSIPIGTVRSRVARARSRLAVVLASHGGGTPRRVGAAGDGGSRR